MKPYELKPKYHYGDKVKVTKGFYTGLVGVVERVWFEGETTKYETRYRKNWLGNLVPYQHPTQDFHIRYEILYRDNRKEVKSLDFAETDLEVL